MSRPTAKAIPAAIKTGPSDKPAKAVARAPRIAGPKRVTIAAVSYTHLTLPTNREV